MRKLFEGHPVPTGIIACDGAIIAWLKDGIIQQYKESSLSHAYAHRAFNAVRSAGVDPILFLTREHDYAVAVVSRHIDETLLDGLRRSDPTRPIVSLEPAQAEGLLDDVSIRAISALSHRAEISLALEKVSAAMSGAHNVRVYSYDETRFGDGSLAWLDAVSWVTRKEEAIEVLLEAKGNHGCRFIACGNGENDVGMLTKASVAFCPVNAVPAIRGVCASACCPFVEGDAFVGWVIEEMTRIRWEDQE